MGLLIIIVNYRTPALTIDCLRSLSARIHEVPGTRAVIVDNASGDDSTEKIQAEIAAMHWEAWATLMPLDRNYGFAGGNNRGLMVLDDGKMDAEFVLLLNSDTLVDPGVLRRCYDVMESEPTIGAMSCRLRNSDGSMQNAARRFPSPARLVAGALGLPWMFPRMFGWADLEDPGWDRMTVRRDVDWLGGAFLFIRRSVIDRVGGLLDEDFFFYGEDIEFCHRIHRAGFRCHYDPQTSIMHIGGASSDPAKLAARQRSVYAWQARYMLQRKCYGRIAAGVVRLTDIVASGLRTIKLRFTGRRKTMEYETQSQILSMLIRPLRAKAG